MELLETNKIRNYIIKKKVWSKSALHFPQARLTVQMSRQTFPQWDHHHIWMSQQKVDATWKTFSSEIRNDCNFSPGENFTRITERGVFDYGAQSTNKIRAPSKSWCNVVQYNKICCCGAKRLRINIERWCKCIGIILYCISFLWSPFRK